MSEVEKRNRTGLTIEDHGGGSAGQLRPASSVSGRVFDLILRVGPGTGQVLAMPGHTRAPGGQGIGDADLSPSKAMSMCPNPPSEPLALE